MARLILSLLVVVLVSIGGLGWTLTQVANLVADNRALQYRSEVATYTQIAKDLASVIEQDGSNLLNSWPKNSRFTIKIIDVEELPLPFILSEQLARDGSIVLESEDDVSIYIGFGTAGVYHSKLLSYSFPVELILSEPRSEGVMLTIVFYLSIVLVLLIWLLPLMNSLIKINRNMLDLGAGKLGARIPLARYSYIGGIERGCNKMADRIQTLMSDNKLLSRAVSHDLKTPLARLRFGIETLMEVKDEQKREEYQHRINHDISEMEALVRRLLEFSKLDESSIQLKRETFELNSYLAAFVENTETPKGKKITFQSLGKTLDFDFDSGYFLMLLNNLISNACRYAKETVRVCVELQPSGWSICIEDDGSGIPKIEREDIFKPFVRGSDSRQGEGHGMGLAIADRIAQWHDLDLQVATSSTLGGAKFSIVYCR